MMSTIIIARMTMTLNVRDDDNVDNVNTTTTTVTTIVTSVAYENVIGVFVW